MRIHNALCAGLVMMMTAFDAAATVAPEHAAMALTAITNAKAIATAGDAQLLSVGDALTSEDFPLENVVVVIKQATLRQLKKGNVLIMAPLGCKHVDQCLLARRVTNIDVAGHIDTESYTVEQMIFGELKASTLGSASYAIDLDTGVIYDLRLGHLQAVTLNQALTRERSVACNHF